MELERIKIPKFCKKKKNTGISTFANTIAFQRNMCLEIFESFFVLAPGTNYTAFV